MLKPSDTWKWYYNETTKALMLDLGQDMVFSVNIQAKMLVNNAFESNEFSIDDANSFHTFREQVDALPLSEPRKAELALNSVAARRFHKPVQPKSWFFSSQGGDFIPEEGEIVHLRNCYDEGLFMVVEVGETASICVSVSLRDFSLTESKVMQFGEPIKVMHDRFAKAYRQHQVNTYAMVG
ncbi:cell division protein ZapC [Vibrio sp. S17_S38]|uniref:cell division protein ZapC n=1 Tax=Vibrio sp. S17_S38 TaxID=2720229 RepID=UPI001680D2D8|nr:cell division protein ZapC [Vibrio sp. S17_S38]MBD1574695.1 cell division protein ZapC [Vibrio sp. S17_S38]